MDTADCRSQHKLLDASRAESSPDDVLAVDCFGYMRAWFQCFGLLLSGFAS